MTIEPPARPAPVAPTTPVPGTGRGAPVGEVDDKTRKKCSRYSRHTLLLQIKNAVLRCFLGM